MKTINRLTVIALILLIVAGFLLAAGSVDAGGGGYCNPLRLKLGGCEPPVSCDLGTPQIQQDADGRYYLQCYYPPTRPESSGPLTLLEPGQRTKIGCPEPVVIYAIPDGESWLVVGCHD